MSERQIKGLGRRSQIRPKHSHTPHHPRSGKTPRKRRCLTDPFTGGH